MSVDESLSSINASGLSIVGVMCICAKGHDEKDWW